MKNCIILFLVGNASPSFAGYLRSDDFVGGKFRLGLHEQRSQLHRGLLSKQCINENDSLEANTNIRDREAQVNSEFDQSVDACSDSTSIAGSSCFTDISSEVIQNYRDTCSVNGGKYLGLEDLKLECRSNVCIPNAAGFYLCPTLNPIACAIDPSCSMDSISGCSSSVTNSCTDVAYDFTWHEKPYCVGNACRCEETADNLANEYLAEVQDDLEKTYAQFGDITFSCSVSWTPSCNPGLRQTSGGGASILTSAGVAMAITFLAVLQN